MISRLPVYPDTISPLLLIVILFFITQLDWRRDCILWFVVFQAILNSIALYLDINPDLTNQYLYHLNCLLSILILSIFFRNGIETKLIRLLVLPTMVIILTLGILNMIFWQGILQFPSTCYAIVSIVIVIYCLIYYLENMMWHKSLDIIKSRNFWHVTGLLTYYATSFFIFISYSYLTELSIQNQSILWKIHNVVFSIMCIYFFIGYKCKPSPKN